MGETIFGITASVFLCVLVGCGLWILIQDWKLSYTNQKDKQKKPIPWTKFDQYVYLLEEQNRVWSAKIRNELLRKKLMEMGIRKIMPEEDEDEENETTRENSDPPSEPV